MFEKIQMLRKKVKLLLKQLRVCIFMEIVFGARCTLKPVNTCLFFHFLAKIRDKTHTFENVAYSEDI